MTLAKKHRSLPQKSNLFCILKHRNETKAKDKDSHCSEGEESDENQESFPWYTPDDPDTYYVVANNQNQTIPAGKQLFLTYGKRNNRYLLAWYGFSLGQNVYDSLSFRMFMTPMATKDFRIQDCVSYEFLTDAHLNAGSCPHPSDPSRTVKLWELSRPFKCKLSKVNLDLVNYLRSGLNMVYKEEFNLNPRTCPLSVPSDKRLELVLFENYIQIFFELLSRYKRADYEDEEMLKDPEIHWKKKLVILTELGYKKIALEQIKLGKIIIGVLKGMIDGRYGS